MGVKSSADYLSILQALLPPGAALSRDPSANLTALLQAFADVLAPVDAAMNTLYDEADPRTTLALLPDWERVTALPDAVVGTAYQSLLERHAWLETRLTSIGGQSEEYFIELAASLGVTITITKFQPWGCGLGQTGRDQDQIGSDDSIWLCWQVNMPAPPVYLFQTGLSMCGEPLGYAQTGVIEALFARYKPAHSTLVFNYEG
jgi:uncharacterized protein YmfQ (DUF2313 family)